MKFEVDLEKLIENSITIQNYLFLQIVYHNNINILQKYKLISEFYNKEDVLFLMSIDLLEFIDENKGFFLSNLKVTDKFIDVFLEDTLIKFKKEKSTVEEWIDEWYELFPKGIRNGMYPVRSGKKGCLIKMKKFIKDNPEYTKDIIMKATKDYVVHSRMNNYKFMQLAHYYIYKNNISSLASGCELIVSKSQEGNDTSLKGDSFNNSLN